MHVYQCIIDGRVAFFPTLADAHDAARPERATVTLWDVPVDRAGLLQLLNARAMPHQSWQLLRRWVVTKRGGLQEVEPLRPIAEPQLSVTAQPRPSSPDDDGPIDWKAPALVGLSAAERDAWEQWKREHRWRTPEELADAAVRRLA